jgi:hypothetical protein
VLAVIGPEWLTCVGTNGKRRIDDPDDFVRLELSKALRRGVRVIPILVQGASMPSAPELPDDLKPLAQHQAVELSDGRWDYDIAQLVPTLDKVLNREPVKAQPRRPIVPIAIGAVVVLVIAVIVMSMTGPTTSEQQAAAPEPTATPTDAAAPAADAPTPAPEASAPTQADAASTQPEQQADTTAGADSQETSEAENAAAGPNAVTMPDVHGMTLADARTTITDAGLRVGRVSYVAADDVETGSVVGTSVPAGMNVRARSGIPLYVAQVPRRRGIHSWGTLALSGSFFYDLDASGTRGAFDIRVSNDQLHALNGALIAVAGDTAPTREECSQARFSTESVAFEDGGFYCVQTNGERFSAIARQGQLLRFETYR